MAESIEENIQEVLDDLFHCLSSVVHYAKGMMDSMLSHSYSLENLDGDIDFWESTGDILSCLEDLRDMRQKARADVSELPTTEMPIISGTTFSHDDVDVWSHYSTVKIRRSDK
jgi:hypothetical protein